MSDTYKKIEAIVLVNNEIMQRINRKKDAKIVSYKYIIEQSEDDKRVPKFIVVESIVEKPVSEVLSSWRCSAQFQVIPDLFTTEKVNYSISTYDELEKLHLAMHTMVKNAYNFMGEVVNSMPAFAKFKTNFEIVQTCLGDIESRFCNSESEKEKYEREVSKANSIMMSLSKQDNVYFHQKSLDLTWMETGDNYKGFKQSEYNPNVYYAVSKSNVMDLNKVFDCPEGFRWATTAEGNAIFGTNGKSTNNYTYYGKGGWNGYNFNGVCRQAFIFCDSKITNKFKHAGYGEEYRLVTIGSDFPLSGISLAGIVCIKK